MDAISMISRQHTDGGRIKSYLAVKPKGMIPKF
jgi:hypothetical protein